MEFDPVVSAELHGKITAGVDAARHLAAQFQEGQKVR
jgi:hypothetical protein